MDPSVKRLRLGLAVAAAVASLALGIAALSHFEGAGSEGFVWSRPLGFTILAALSALSCARLVWLLRGERRTRRQLDDRQPLTQR